MSHYGTERSDIENASIVPVATTHFPECGMYLISVFEGTRSLTKIVHGINTSRFKPKHTVSIKF